MEFSQNNFAAVWTGRQVLVWGGLTGPFQDQKIPPHGSPTTRGGQPVVGDARGGVAWPQQPDRGLDRPPDDRLGRHDPRSAENTPATDGAAYTPATR
jgi:hypothetical protein